MPVSPVSPAQPLWRHPEFAQGIRDMLPTALGVAAWGLITGVAMGRSGLPMAVMILMSLLVFAGSAQLAVLPLMIGGAPLWVIWATALCVNLRFLIFSAQWRPYVVHMTLGQRLRWAYVAVDMNYVLFMRRYPKPEPSPGQPAYFWGGALTTWVFWQFSSVPGIVLAESVPVHWGLGFVGTLTLLALALASLQGRATAVAGAVAGCAAVAAYAMPYKLNIVVAIAAAVAIGLLMDHRPGRKPGVSEGPAG